MARFRWGFKFGYSSSVLAIIAGGGLFSTADYFDEDGATSPWYSSSQFSAFYDATSDKTFMSFEAISAAGKRFPRVKAYDHAAQAWGRSYASGNNGLIQDDDHGAPVMALNADGRIVCVYGNHDGNFRMTISTNARDNTLWTQASDIVGAYAYPHLVLLPDNSMICFFRKNFAPGAGGFANGAKVLVYRRLTFVGTAITVAAEVTIGDMGNDSRWYQGNAYLRPDGYIHQVCTKADFNDNWRRGVYFYKVDIAGQRLLSIAGTAVNFPVTSANMEATFKVYTTGVANTSNTPGFAYDANGRAHILVADGDPSDGGVGAVATPQDVKHLVSTGSAFAAPSTIGISTHRYNGYAVVPYPDGSIACVWSKDPTNLNIRGGAIVKRVLASGAASTAFAAEALVLGQNPAGRALDSPIGVKDGDQDIRMLIFERAPTSNDSDAGFLKLYALGDNGLKFKRRPALVTPNALTGDGFWLDLSDLTQVKKAALADAAFGDEIIRITDKFGTGNILTGVAGTAPFVGKTGGQFSLKYTGSSAGTRYLTGASKAWTAGGFMTTTIIRHWMPATVSQSVVSMDGGTGFPRLAMPCNVNGPQIRAQAFNGTVSTIAAGGAAAQPYQNDYIVQTYTIGTNLHLYVNGVLMQTIAITGGAVNVTSQLLRIGANANASPGAFFMGSIFGMIHRVGEQTVAMRDADYLWALSQLPL